MLLCVIVLLAKFPKIIFVFQLGREKKIDITMLKLLKILHITQNENDSEVDKIIKTTDDENKSFALLTWSNMKKRTLKMRNGELKTTKTRPSKIKKKRTSKMKEKRKSKIKKKKRMSKIKKKRKLKNV